MTPGDRKALVLDAAESLLLESGNSELTMRKIAQRAGMSLGNLQYHFSNRDAVLVAVLRRFVERYEDGLLRLTQRPEHDLTASLHMLFLDVFNYPDLDAYAAMFKELWAASSHSIEMKKALTTYLEQLTQSYQRTLTNLAPSRTSPQQIKRATMVLVPLLEGYCLAKDAIHVPPHELASEYAKVISQILTQP